MPVDLSPIPDPAPAYRRGDTGPAVAEIRAKLGLLGLLAEGEDAELLDPAGALFDEATDRAVRAFQQQRGMRTDVAKALDDYALSLQRAAHFLHVLGYDQHDAASGRLLPSQ
jgi:peptidoglycan hydrolase-like protein with peptidoglycan-binding domain